MHRRAVPSRQRHSHCLVPADHDPAHVYNNDGKPGSDRLSVSTSAAAAGSGPACSDLDSGHSNSAATSSQYSSCRSYWGTATGGSTCSAIYNVSSRDNDCDYHLGTPEHHYYGCGSDNGPASAASGHHAHNDCSSSHGSGAKPSASTGRRRAFHDYHHNISSDSTPCCGSGSIRGDNHACSRAYRNLGQRHGSDLNLGRCDFYDGSWAYPDRRAGWLSAAAHEWATYCRHNKHNIRGWQHCSVYFHDDLDTACTRSCWPRTNPGFGRA